MPDNFCPSSQEYKTGEGKEKRDGKEVRLLIHVWGKLTNQVRAKHSDEIDRHKH